MLRSKVGAALGVRFTPTLAFVRDTVPDDGAHGWRSCWLAHGPQMRIWREFGRVPSTQARPTRTVRPGRRVPSGDLDDGLDAEDTGDRDRQDD